MSSTAGLGTTLDLAQPLRNPAGGSQTPSGNQIEISRSADSSESEP